MLRVIAITIFSLSGKMFVIGDWRSMRVSGCTRDDARNLSRLTNMPSCPDECLVWMSMSLFICSIFLSDVDIFSLNNFRKCMFWLISMLFCEIRAYIYEQVVKCFYDFLRVTNSFSVFYERFYTTFFFVCLRYHFMYGYPNTSNIIIFIKLIVLINSFYFTCGLFKNFVADI